MPLTAISGPPASGKTDRLLTAYRTRLAENRPGAALWLAPTWRAAAEVRRRLLGGVLQGCFSPAVMTFDQFAETILHLVPEPIRPLGRSMKRHLIRQLIEQHRAAGDLDYFAPIAATGGLVDLVCDLIGELKRLEIWPEQFAAACAARGMSQKDRELLDLYRAYQQRLQEHHLYDAEGRFWSARDWLKKTWSPPESGRPWPKLRLVVADGFTDFTRTQHEILEILDQGVEEVLVSLPLEPRDGDSPSPLRADLFSKPLATLAELGRRHSGMKIEELPRPKAPAWPAMAHLEQRLFDNPRHAQPAADTTGLEVLAAARPLGEIELIAGRIKRLLVEGDLSDGGRAVRPGEIAVVFRTPQDAGGLVGEVFRDFGIPAAFEAGRPLGREPAAAALLALLRLDADDWPLRALLAVLGSNYFCPEWPEWRGGGALAAVDREIRRRQIPQGRRQLLDELQTGAQDTNAQVAAAVLGRLAAALDELPERSTLAAWGQAWRQLARQVGLLQAIESDEAAWRCLGEALRESGTLFQWLGQDAPELDRRAALAALLDVVQSQRLGSSGDESGHVRVLSAQSVRGLHVPYLFLAGLCEKAFPLPQGEDRLYSEADYQRLIEQGLPLVARRERNAEEMLLFYEAVTRATRRLWLSYPALDAAAQALSPSPYLQEVELACGPGRIARCEQTDLSPVPPGDEPLSAAEFRIKAVATALEGNVDLLAGLLRCSPLPHPVEGVVAGLMLQSLRQDRISFGPAEGMMSGRALRRRLAADFSPERTFTATELEQYASCPYRYFLAKVLKAEPVEELELEVDYLERGRLAHELMAAFHRRVNQLRSGPASPAALSQEEYQQLLGETLQEVTGDAAAGTLAGALREINRRLLVRWLADYRGQHQQYDALWQNCETPLRPEFFEVSFGRQHGDHAPPSTPQPLELCCGEQTVRIAGRIDRIDTGRVAGTAVFNVLDYKTGGSVRFNVEAVARGTALQLPLYAIATVDVVLVALDCVPWQAGYWYLRGGGFKPKQSLKMYHAAAGSLEPDEQWESIRALLAKTVAALVRGMREGQFPVWSADPYCTSYCEFATVCRINHIRSLEKTWQPPCDQD